MNLYRYIDDPNKLDQSGRKYAIAIEFMNLLDIELSDVIIAYPAKSIKITTKTKNRLDLVSKTYNFKISCYCDGDTVTIIDIDGIKHQYKLEEPYDPLIENISLFVYNIFSKIVPHPFAK